MAGAPYSDRQFKKILKNNGYKLKRQTGSHEIYRNDAGDNIVIRFNKFNPLLIECIIKKHALRTDVL